MVDTLLIDLFKQLGSIAVQLAKHEINLLVAVDEEVQKLQGKLGMIKAMLDDAEERHAVKQPDYLLTAPLLNELEISSSQLLKERYQRAATENWHQISHIPNIKLDWVYVQRDDEPQFDSKVTMLPFFFFLYFIFSFQIYQLNINIWIGL